MHYAAHAIAGDVSHATADVTKFASFEYSVWLERVCPNEVMIYDRRAIFSNACVSNSQTAALWSWLSSAARI